MLVLSNRLLLLLEFNGPVVTSISCFPRFWYYDNVIITVTYRLR